MFVFDVTLLCVDCFVVLFIGGYWFFVLYCIWVLRVVYCLVTMLLWLGLLCFVFVFDLSLLAWLIVCLRFYLLFCRAVLLLWCCFTFWVCYDEFVFDFVV